MQSSLMLIDLLKQAGAFAGLSVSVVLYPLDTLKTRIQAPWYRELYGSTVASRNPALYRGLYQGVGTVIIVAVPSAGVFFSTYEGLKYALRSSSLPTPIVHALSSAVAQVINCAIVIPVEVIKQNAQVVTQIPKNLRSQFHTLEIARHLIKQHPSRLWRGYSALLMRDLPFTALQFPMLEHIKKALLARSKSRKKENGNSTTLHLLEHLKIAGLSGSVAGSAAALVTTPADVVKTRMMLEVGYDRLNQQGRNVTASIGSRSQWQIARRGTMRIYRDIWVEEGLRGLFRGGLIRTAWTAVGNGLFISCYEGAKLTLQTERVKTLE